MLAVPSHGADVGPAFEHMGQRQVPGAAGGGLVAVKTEMRGERRRRNDVGRAPVRPACHRPDWQPTIISVSICPVTQCPRLRVRSDSRVTGRDRIDRRDEIDRRMKLRR